MLVNYRFQGSNADAFKGNNTTHKAFLDSVHNDMDMLQLLDALSGLSPYQHDTVEKTNFLG
jgi:hypothetical protein